MDAPLRQVRDLFKLSPLRGQDAERMAVERDDLSIHHRPEHRISEHLRLFADEQPKILLSGSRGCGKSTELARTALRLQDRFLVVGLPVEENQVRDQRLSAEELVLLVGLAVARAAREIWGLPLERELAALDGAVKPLLKVESGFDLGSLLNGLVLFGTTMFEPTGSSKVVMDLVNLTTSSLGLSVEFPRLERPTRDRTPLQELLDSVNRLIEIVSREGGRPPLVLVDDLDKIQDADEAYHLLTDDGLIAGLECAMVLTGPASVLHSRRSRHLDEVYSEIAVLYHIRARSHSNPGEADGAGRSKLIELIDRRLSQVGAPDALATREARELLADASGGSIRDLVRSMEIASRLALAEAAPRIELRHAQGALERILRPFEFGLTDEALDCLAEVRRTRSLPASDLACDLLNERFILAYSGPEKLWYYPHAVLLDLIEGRHG